MERINSNIIAKGIIKAVLFFLVLTVFVYVLDKIFPVIVYLVIAWLLSLLGSPVKTFLQRRFKFPAGLAAAAVLLIYTLAALLFVGLFVPLVMRQAENLSVLQSAAFKAKIETALGELQRYLEAHRIRLPENLNLWAWLKDIDWHFVPAFFQGVFGLLGDLFIGVFSVLFITWFLLRNPGLLGHAIRRILPRHDTAQFARARARIKTLMRHYVAGLLMQVGILFVIYALSLSLIGVPDAVIIALIGALLNLVPYVGPLVGLVLMISLSITSQLNDPAAAFGSLKWILLMYAVAQLIDNFFSQPFIYSRSVQSHPLEIFLVILTSGYLFGILGMVIAVPAYTIVKILLREFYTEYRERFFSW